MAWAEKYERIRNRQPVERSLRIPLDQGAAEEAAEAARVALAAARAEATRRFAQTIDDGADLSAVVERSPAVREAMERLRAAEAEAEAATEAIVVRAMPSYAYEALLDAHPPDDAARERGEAYNAATFAPALLAACHVERNGSGEGPEEESMTVEQATELLRHSPAGDARLLFQLALAVNQQTLVRLTDLGKG